MHILQVPSAGKVVGFDDYIEVILQEKIVLTYQSHIQGGQYFCEQMRVFLLQIRDLKSFY